MRILRSPVIIGIIGGILAGAVPVAAAAQTAGSQDVQRVPKRELSTLRKGDGVVLADRTSRASVQAVDEQFVSLTINGRSFRVPHNAIKKIDGVDTLPITAANVQRIFVQAK